MEHTKRKILVMGLPGSGKTTFAMNLFETMLFNDLSVRWLNADRVREEYNDWDFSEDGRIRQANRMKSLATHALSSGCSFVIADFVCPTMKAREFFEPDIIVFMDTIDAGRYDDTNKMFDRNCNPTYTITNWNDNKKVTDEILYSLLSLR